MHGFMEVSKEYCDKIESSSGFIVRQIDKLTAEVYNIQQAGGTPDNINNDVLLAHLNNPEKDILEYGTLLVNKNHLRMLRMVVLKNLSKGVIGMKTGSDIQRVVTHTFTIQVM